MTQPTDNNTLPQNTLSQTALNVILVVIETLLTLLLRFDGQLRQLAYPLAQDNTVVCIRSYVPHVTFYATFTVNGILLDSELQPSQQVDVTINGFTWQIAQAVFTHKSSVIEQLQIRGELDKVAQVKAFLLAIGVTQVVENLKASVIGSKSEKDDKEKEPKTTSAQYRERISEQQTQINKLTIAQTEFDTHLAQLKSQNKLLKISLGIAVILCIICAVGWIIK
jgi:hypothetical protein